MNISSFYRSDSFTNTQQIGTKIGEEIKKKGEDDPNNTFIICLYGELGSGKTTFTQGFARALGQEARVISPTFLIVKSYELSNLKHFYHLDLYRIYGVPELETVGISEIIQEPGAIVVIEWPEKIEQLLPKKRLDIHFLSENENIRELTIKNAL